MATPRRNRASSRGTRGAAATSGRTRPRGNGANPAPTRRRGWATETVAGGAAERRPRGRCPKLPGRGNNGRRVGERGGPARTAACREGNGSGNGARKWAGDRAASRDQARAQTTGDTPRRACGGNSARRARREETMCSIGRTERGRRVAWRLVLWAGAKDHRGLAGRLLRWLLGVVSGRRERRK